MKAEVLLLAAGFGRRLGALTQHVPKPLIPLGDSTLIERNLELLSRDGAKRVFVNVHYLPELIIEQLGDGSRWNLEILYSREAIILDTGGAISQIRSELEAEELLVVNADIVLGSEFSFREVVRQHQQSPQNPLATLVLRHDPEAVQFGEFGLNAEGRIVSFLGETFSEPIERSGLMFTGVHVLSRKFVEQLPPAGTVFSVTQDSYRGALRAGEYLSGLLYDGYWTDAGTPERLEAAQQRFS